MRGGRNHPGFALDRLQHDCHGPGIHGRVQRRKVIERNVTEAWQLRLESIDQAGTVRRRYRRETTPVATVIGHDDSRGTTAMLLSPLACQLDRRFAGFTATVEQVRLVTAGTGAQALGEVEHPAVMQTETGVDQRPGLRREGIDQCRRTMPEAIGAYTL
ncbi:hypothetical protein D3C86_1578560 [compost metagenome]